MAKFKCPSCKEQSISLKDKYRMGWWMTANCEQCGARIAAFPWVLMLVSFAYVWNVIWWAGLVVFNQSAHYLIFMAICWVLIDLINLYFMPLVTLRKKATTE